MDAAERRAALASLEIVEWTPRVVEPQSPTMDVGVSIPSSASVQGRLAIPETTADVGQLDWTALRARVDACRACELCQTRTQTVFGVGDHSARLLIVGEAPGAEEDRLGEPFVGPAGRLLDEMLRAIGLQRQQVYICNILKCRPPRNADPTPAQAAACRPYLERQIALVAPQLILAVGRIAAQNLLQVATPIGRLRGQCHSIQIGEAGGRVPVWVTYHPAYLLRSPREKARAWDDLKAVRRWLEAEQP